MGRRQTLSFNNKEFWSETEKIADEKLIYEFEEKIGHKLPESFIELSKMFHHGETQKARFYVNEDMSPTLSYMLSFNKDNKANNIWGIPFYGLTDFDPYVVIAQDIAGNLIALDYSKSETEPSVVFVDHELLGMIFLEEDREYSEEEIEAMETSERLKDFPWAIFHVADSFLDFLNRLDGEVPYEPEEGEWYEVDKAKQISENDIKIVEEKINKKFPTKFHEVILKYDNKMIANNFIKGFNDEMSFVAFKSFDEDSRDYIMILIEDDGLEYWRELIVFGYGNALDFVCFDYTDSEEPTIVLVDLENVFKCNDSIMDQYDKYTKLADNFEEFCNKMKYPPTAD